MTDAPVPQQPCDEEKNTPVLFFASSPQEPSKEQPEAGSSGCWRGDDDNEDEEEWLARMEEHYRAAPRHIGPHGF